MSLQPKWLQPPKSDVIGFTALLSKEFKLWLSRHPGLTIEEVLRRYRDEQKQRSRVRLKH